MNAMSRGVFVLLFAALRAADAQDGAASSDTTRSAHSAQSASAMAMGTWAVAPFFGAARHSPAGYNWGITSDRDHMVLGVHFATPVLRVGPFSLLYAPNVVPLVIVTNNPRYKTVETNTGLRRIETGRGNVYGAGLVPFGLQAEARATRSADLYGMAAMGAVLFADAMPQDGARRLNFSIEFGGGLLVRTQSRHALQLGYKFYHLSNMYTARENPGLDGHMFYLGVRWQKHARRE